MAAAPPAAAALVLRPAMYDTLQALPHRRPAAPAAVTAVLSTPLRCCEPPLLCCLQMPDEEEEEEKEKNPGALAGWLWRWGWQAVAGWLW